MSTLSEQERFFDILNDAVIVRTTDGRINSWNSRAATLYGWKREEALGKISHDLLETEFPKPLKEIESEVVRNGLWEGELIHATRDHNRVVVRSRWVLDPTEPSGAVLEINVPADGQAGLPGGSSNKVLSKVANFPITTGAILCSLALLYFFRQYAWTETLVTTSVANALYYIIPTALATFLFSALRFGSRTKINIALLGFSLVCTLCLLELLLLMFGASPRPVEPVMARLYRSSDKERQVAQLTSEFGVNIDLRSASQVIAEFHDRGVDAVPIVTPGNHLFRGEADGSGRSVVAIDGQEVLPLAGIANKTTILCNEGGQWIDYRSDEHGFNNPPESWQYKQIEIAAIGDSFTHGYCVPPDKGFVSLIRQQHPATLNLGVSGDGPLLELAKINEYLNDRRPPIVLWFYYEGNDLTDLQRERKSPLLMQYLKAGFTQRELADQNAVDQAILNELPHLNAVQRANLERQQSTRARSVDAFLKWAKLSILRQRLGLIGPDYSDAFAPKSDLDGTNMYVFGEILAEAKTRVAAWGGRLYFVYLPDWARYSHHDLWGLTKRDEVLKTIGDLEIPVIDLNPAFAAHKDPLSLFPFRGPGHYNVSGNQLVAEQVLKSLFELHTMSEK